VEEVWGKVQICAPWKWMGGEGMGTGMSFCNK
jgi:hypothetical protein